MTHGPVGTPVTRSSVRSRSSAGSSSADDPREKVKACCRKLVEFMCTQVGVGGLVVSYALAGAFAFQAIETYKGNETLHEAEIKKGLEGFETKLKEQYLIINKMNRSLILTGLELWELTVSTNIFNETVWKTKANNILLGFQEKVITEAKNGYNGLDPDVMWSYPAALMFCLSIFTMIGYGNMIPRTLWGKVATVVYAVFGIPVYILYFMNMGKVLANCFRWIYRTIYECSTKKPSVKIIELENGDTIEKPRVIVPSTACLWVITGYVLVGTIMFAEWEKWDYLDAVYFCVTSLCKIGIGDFVPGANIKESQSGNNTKLIINFVYLLLGMGLVAMCYNLMREEVKVKMQELRADMRRWMEGISIKSCLRRKKKSKRSRKYKDDDDDDER